MFRMTVDDVFFIRGRGTVVTGRVEEGLLRVGDEVCVNQGTPVRVDAIEAFRRVLDQAQAGDNVGLLITALDRSQVEPDDVITGVGGAAPNAVITAAGGAAPEAGTGAPEIPSSAPVVPDSGRSDLRFADIESQRGQFLSMQEAGLMSIEQVDAALANLAFSCDGREWKLTAGSAQWLASDGGGWKHAQPPR